MSEETNPRLSKPEAPDCGGRCVPPPSRVHYFNITYACNSRCRFCAADLAACGKNPPATSIPFNTFIRLLDELDLRGEDQVILNGGEPTIHPEFLEFLRAIAQRGAKCTVFTNGRKLADASFAQVVASYHPVELLIPIYSCDAQAHDACTGVNGSFVQTLNGIKAVFDLQQRGFALPVEIRLLLSRTTAPHAAGVVRFLCQVFKDGDFCFSLNPLIVSQQAREGGHVASLFDYVAILEAVKRQCAAHDRELITKNLPRCLLWTVCPELAISTGFLGDASRSQESYFDPLRLTPGGGNDQREYAAACRSCILREACPGFPVGHANLFGDIDARPVAYDEIIGKTAELLLPLIGPNDRIDVAGSRYIALPGGSPCLVEPETGSWLTPEDDSIVDYFETHGSFSVAQIEHAFPAHGSQIVANLLLSGVGRLNGRRLAPQDNCATDSRRPRIAALVIKYTRNCNLRCAYCYAHDCSRVSGRTLPNETIIAALDSLTPVLADPCDLIIHGGEPLLRVEDLKELLRHLKERSLADRMSLNIQTNAVLITEACAEFLREHSISVGVSVDGITLHENSYRIFNNGDPSLGAALEGIKHLLAAGIKPGLISVLHRKNQRSLLDSLKAYASFGISNFVVNPLFPGGAAKALGPLALPETDAALEMLQNMLLWINDENQNRPGASRLYERNLSTLVQHLTTYQRPYMCARIPCGAGLYTLSIDADGSVYPCDDFMSAPEFRIGSVAGLKDPDSFFGSNAVVSHLHSRSIKQCSPCHHCTWQAVCPSHCAAESYFTAGDVFHGGILCEVMQRFIPIVLRLLSTRRIDPQFIIKSPVPVRRVMGSGHEIEPRDNKRLQTTRTSRVSEQRC